MVTDHEDQLLKLEQLLLSKFPGSRPASEHFLGLLEEYNSSGFAEEKLFSEVLSSSEDKDKGKFWENLWEAMIYRHLSHLNYPLIDPVKKGEDRLGPDFCFSCEDKKIWIEATSLNPGLGFPSGWLDVVEGQVCSMPHSEMLLRWTSAIRAKKDKLNDWIEKDIVPADDPYIIAVNSSQLSWWPSEDRGISQLPWAVEVAYPVGPQDFSGGEILHSARTSIKKTPSSDVPTAIFLDSAYNGVSAIIGCARCHMLGNKSYMDDADFLTVVHNPFASNPCPQKIFGSFSEYTMKEEGDLWVITRI